MGASFDKLRTNGGWAQDERGRARDERGWGGRAGPGRRLNLVVEIDGVDQVVQVVAQAGYV